MAREHRSQIQNKRAAFRRMGQSPQFKAWARRMVAEMDGKPSLETQVDEMMERQHLRVEVFTGQQWSVIE